MNTSSTYTFESKSVHMAHNFAKIMFAVVLFLMMFEFIIWFCKGYVFGASILAAIFALFAIAAISFKGQVSICQHFYKSEYQVLGFKFNKETCIKGWQLLYVTYDTSNEQDHFFKMPYIQFYLSARNFGTASAGVSLFQDLSFDLDDDPMLVAETIKKLQDATGFSVIFEHAALRDLYPVYQQMYGELID